MGLHLRKQTQVSPVLLFILKEKFHDIILQIKTDDFGYIPVNTALCPDK